LVALDPELAKSLLLDRDTTGAPVYGPQTQRTMSSLGQMALTEEQRQNLKLKADDDARKSQEAAIRQADEKRKEKLTDARVALLHAQTYKARREPEAKAKSVAVKPATSADRNAAASAIDAEFEGAKFSPGSREKMAADVADRARKIFADAAASGNSIGMDEARDQAMEELKPFVTDKTVVIKEPMDILGYKVGGESQSYKVYTKGVTKPAQTGAGVSTVTTQEQYDALKPGATYVGPDGKRYVKRVTKPAQTGAGVPTVTTQEQYDALKPGATYVGPDGKRYVKRG
jgi:membrane protein involved in colicin uptake